MLSQWHVTVASEMRLVCIRACISKARRALGEGILVSARTPRCTSVSTSDADPHTACLKLRYLTVSNGAQHQPLPIFLHSALQSFILDNRQQNPQIIQYIDLALQLLTLTTTIMGKAGVNWDQTETWSVDQLDHPIDLYADSLSSQAASCCEHHCIRRQGMSKPQTRSRSLVLIRSTARSQANRSVLRYNI